MRLWVGKRNFFIIQGQKRINPVFLAAIALALTGCSLSTETTDKQFYLAPPPPLSDAQEMIDSGERNFGVSNALPLPSQLVLNETALESDPAYLPPAEKKSLTSEEKQKSCSIRDRFDRDALVAYQWGPNKLSLKAHGISWAGADIDSVKLEYRLRLQDYKSRREKCRYESHWQGMIGSGYNELFLRENNTVYDDINKIRNDIDDGISKLF